MSAPASGWDLVFILINLYQLYRLVLDRLSFRLPVKERALLRKALVGLDDAQITRLLGAGALSDLEPGSRLAEENQPLEKLYFLCAGRVSVTIAGRAVSQLKQGNFVGEVAFLTERPATATVIAETEVRALAFDRNTLKKFFQNETEVAGLIYVHRARTCAQDQGQQHPDRVRTACRASTAGSSRLGKTG